MHQADVDVKVIEPIKKQEALPAATEQVLHPEPADTRGEFEKEGRDLTEEAIAEATKSPIDLNWLKEQVDILQGKKLGGWTNTNIVAHLNSITGKEAKKVSEAVSYLNKYQAAAFVQKVKDTVGMA